MDTNSCLTKHEREAIQSILVVLDNFGATTLHIRPSSCVSYGDHDTGVAFAERIHFAEMEGVKLQLHLFDKIIVQTE